MHTKTKDSDKNSNLATILQTHFGKSINRARIKFIALFLEALCKQQTVTLHKIALGFNSSVNSSSSLRRIERFLSAYELQFGLISRLIVSLLPTKPPFTLSIDRTHWKSAEVDINALVLAVCYHGVAFPIMFKMLPKSGNSNTGERIELIDEFIELFAIESINHLVADREFVGEKWISYLNSMKIRYYLRLKENFYVIDPRNGKRIKLSHLFNNVIVGESRPLRRIYLIGKEYCYLSASRVKNHDGKPELQIIASFNKPELSKDAYKKRWQIECAFKSLKTSGFNIEDTHLRDIERFRKLLSLVLIAFTWAYLTGLYVHNNIKPIRLCKHGYFAKSFVKYGLEILVYNLINNCKSNRKIDITLILSGS